MENALLKLENVSLSSGDLVLLEDVSFTVNIGENIIFFGPENSGLDVLYSVILGFEDKFEGDILYKGDSIKEFDYITDYNYRKGIGYLHPECGLISNMTVEQNILLPLEYHSKKSRKEIMMFVNDIIEGLNLNYCRELRPVDLSNSEILRTAYARAIILDPDILLIEHPYSGQSPFNIQSFLQIVKKKAIEPDKSTIFITYEPKKFIDLADKFIMMSNGRIVFQGSRDEFNESNSSYVNQYINMSDYGPMKMM